MQPAKPHFLLYAEALARPGMAPCWKFVLQRADRDETFSAADIEPTTRANRLELLAVVRGLEALDQPSRVTLLTRSRYVRRGLRRELGHWRDRQWRWERFGHLVPIRDHDLWRRIDRALDFHQLECRAWQPEGLSPTSLSGCAAGRWHRRRGMLSWGHASLQPPLQRLYQGVSAAFSAIFRPPFTRAA